MSRAYHRGFTTLSIVLFAITLLITTPVMATDFYVAAGGVDYGASGPDSKSLTKSNGCSDSKTPCGSITHATALAKAGDVINLAAGLYSRGEAFPLFIRKGVTLQGSKDGDTIIEGSDLRALVVVEADSADIDTKTIIRNIKIRGNYEGAGLAIGSGNGPMQNGLIKSGGGGMNDLIFTTGTNTLTGVTTASVYVNVFVSGTSNTANVSLLTNRIYSNAYGVVVSAGYVAYPGGLANVNLKNNFIFLNTQTGVANFAGVNGVVNMNMTGNKVYSNGARGVSNSAGASGTVNLYMRSNTVTNNGSDGVMAIAYNSAVVKLTALYNQFNSNSGGGVDARASNNATANVYMKSNSVNRNSNDGFRAIATTSAVVKLTALYNQFNSNSGSGVDARASNNATANVYMKSNSVNNNSNGIDADAVFSAVLNLTAYNNQISNNSYTGLGLRAFNASANGLFKYNSINSNNTGATIGQFSVNATFSRNYIAGNNNTGLSVYAWPTGGHSVYLKNNIFYGNSPGIYGGGGGTAYVKAGPYGAKTGLNTFNNPTNIAAAGATFNTDDNWWPVNDAYASPLDIPLSCTVSPTSLTTAGGAITVTAASGSTYFVDNVGALPKRLTVAVGGVAGTVGAVAAGQTSLTATAPAMAAGTYTLTVTNAGGQVCNATITYTGRAATATNSAPYDATGGGTDWLYYPEDAQTNVPTGTVIKWTELTDANGDTITYTLYLCHKDDWDSDANDCTNWIAITGITANGGAATAGVALAANGMATAGGGGMVTAGGGGMATAGGAMLFAIGLVGAIRSRKGRAFMMALMMIASAGMIASCSTDSDDDTTDSATTYTVCTDEAGIICEDIEADYTLDPNTEYHWYVNASDGNGGSTNSDTRSFTTGSN